MKRLGASLIAISPEKPDNTLSMVEKLELSFPVLSDVKGKVMRDYKISWKLPEKLKEQYLTLLKRDFTIINEGAGWELPIPATFILDKDGKVRYHYVNVDFTKRLEPAKILEILKDL